jgi:hypothetical protein
VERRGFRPARRDQHLAQLGRTRVGAQHHERGRAVGHPADLGGLDDANLPGGIAGQRDASVSGHRGGQRHARDDLEPDPGLGARRGFGGRAVQQRITAEQPDRELPVLRGLDERLGRRRRVGGLGQPGVGAHVAPRDDGQVRGRDDQAGLAEQFGRAYRQQPLVARTGADEGDPSGRRLLHR